MHKLIAVLSQPLCPDQGEVLLGLFQGYAAFSAIITGFTLVIIQVGLGKYDDFRKVGEVFVGGGKLRGLMIITLASFGISCLLISVKAFITLGLWAILLLTAVCLYSVVRMIISFRGVWTMQIRSDALSNAARSRFRSIVRRSITANSQDLLQELCNDDSSNSQPVCQDKGLFRKLTGSIDRLQKWFVSWTRSQRRKNQIDDEIAHLKEHAIRYICFRQYDQARNVCRWFQENLIFAISEVTPRSGHDRLMRIWNKAAEAITSIIIEASASGNRGLVNYLAEEVALSANHAIKKGMSPAFGKILKSIEMSYRNTSDPAIALGILRYCDPNSLFICNISSLTVPQEEEKEIESFLVELLKMLCEVACDALTQTDKTLLNSVIRAISGIDSAISQRKNNIAPVGAATMLYIRSRLRVVMNNRGNPRLGTIARAAYGNALSLSPYDLENSLNAAKELNKIWDILVPSHTFLCWQQYSNHSSLFEKIHASEEILIQMALGAESVAEVNQLSGDIKTALKKLLDINGLQKPSALLNQYPYYNQDPAIVLSLDAIIQ